MFWVFFFAKDNINLYNLYLQFHAGKKKYLWMCIAADQTVDAGAATRRLPRGGVAKSPPLA